MSKSKFDSPLYSVNVKEAMDLVQAAEMVLRTDTGNRDIAETLLDRAWDDLDDLRQRLEQAEEAWPPERRLDAMLDGMSPVERARFRRELFDAMQAIDSEPPAVEVQS